MRDLRAACAAVAERSQHVRIERAPVAAYAAGLPLDKTPPAPDSEAHLLTGSKEQLAAFWLTLDAINFGSGWFPTLRKRDGQSGYFTVAIGVLNRFTRTGPWSAEALAQLDTNDVADALGQDHEHDLMRLYARSLRDLGVHVAAEHGGRFANVGVRSAGRRSRWPDTSAAGTASPTPRPMTSSRFRSSSAPRSPPPTWPGRAWPI